MTTVAANRDSLMDALATITGLHAYAYWPDTVLTPGAVVRPTSGRYYRAQGGGMLQLFEVVFVAAPVQPGVRRGQEILDPYVEESGTSSVLAAVETNMPAATVTRFEDYGALEINGIEYIGCRFIVEVEA